MTALFTSHIFYVLTSIIKYEAGDTGRFCYGEMLIERRLMESVAECGSSTLEDWRNVTAGGGRDQARPGQASHAPTL